MLRSPPPKSSFSSSGAASAAWVQPCDIRPRSKTRPLSSLFAYLTALGTGARPEPSHTWRFGLPTYSPLKRSPCPRLLSTPPPDWPAFLLHPLPRQRLGGGGGGHRLPSRTVAARTAPEPPPPSPPRGGVIKVDSSDDSGSDAEGGRGTTRTLGQQLEEHAFNLGTRPILLRFQIPGQEKGRGGRLGVDPLSGQASVLGRGKGPLE